MTRLLVRLDVGDMRLARRVIFMICIGRRRLFSKGCSGEIWHRFHSILH